MIPRPLAPGPDHPRGPAPRALRPAQGARGLVAALSLTATLGLTGCPPTNVLPPGAEACSPPADFQAPAPKRAAGEACRYALECEYGVCVAGTCAGDCSQVTPGWDASWPQIMAAACGTDALSNVCLPPAALPAPARPCQAAQCVNAAQAEGCAADAPCTSNAQCCDRCYIKQGEATGTCVAPSRAADDFRCPDDRRQATLAATDPVSYCVPR